MKKTILGLSITNISSFIWGYCSTRSKLEHLPLDVKRQRRDEAEYDCRLTGEVFMILSGLYWLVAPPTCALVTESLGEGFFLAGMYKGLLLTAASPVFLFYAGKFSATQSLKANAEPTEQYNHITNRK